MKKILPKGFTAGAVHCGIKKTKKDLALIYSKIGCKAAAVFTKNKVKAAPLLISKDILNKGEPIKAVIINSGNANCCTGWYGTRDAKRMVAEVSKNLKIRFNNVLVSSTGIIGKRLPIDLIEKAMPKLIKSISEKGIVNLAKGISTTDKILKVYVEKINIGKKEVIISGVAKGAGMIHPNMATMLAFMMTDAKIDKDALKSALKEASDESFNAITVDGDMSTNDTALLMANGASGNKTIKNKTKEYYIFLKGLKDVCIKLAKDIVRDGEGATKLVEVYVKNAKTKSDAKKVAETIATSSLVKTSIYGENPNWGRVASSVGSSGVKNVRQNKFEVYLDKICVFKKGKAPDHLAEKFHKIYKKKNVEIVVDLHTGTKEARMWTCDLTKKYVEINSHYMT